MPWYFAYSKSSIDGPREASDFHPAGDQKASNRILSARLSTMAAYEAELVITRTQMRLITAVVVLSSRRLTTQYLDFSIIFVSGDEQRLN